MHNATTSDLHSIGPAILSDVYNLAESLYLMAGGLIPDGGKFTRGVDDLSESCYRAASVSYLKHMEDQIDGE